MSTAILARPLRAAMANARLAFAGARLSTLLAKANFNPNQPRVPAGTREGGQWVRVGGDVPHISPPAIPEQGTHLGLAAGASSLIKFGAVLVPRERPVTLREANRTAWDIAKELIKFGARSTAIGRLIELAGDAVWLYDHWDDIVAYLDPPRPLEELRHRARTPTGGYEVHHIVEQTPARRDKLPEELIESFENRVLVPRFRHWEITGWYASKLPGFGWRSPRDYLRNSDWAARERYGVYTLRLFKIQE